MIDMLLQGITLSAVIIIVVLAESRINRITIQSRPWFVIAFILLSGACLWEIMEILSGAVPDIATACASVGVSILLLEERHCPRSCARMRETSRFQFSGNRRTRPHSLF